MSNRLPKSIATTVPLIVNLNDATVDEALIGWAAHTTREVLVRAKKDTPKDTPIVSTQIITTAAQETVAASANLRRLAKDLTNNLSPHDTKNIQRASQRLLRAWSTVVFPKNVERALASAYTKSNVAKSKNRHSLIIRPSPAGQAPSQVSELGQYELVGDITTERQFLTAVRRLWGSVYSEAALTWRLQHGHDPVGPTLALAVQAAPSHTTIGYLYTSDPLLNTRAIWYAENSEITATCRLFVSPDSQSQPVAIESTNTAFATTIAAAASALSTDTAQPAIRAEFFIEANQTQLAWALPWPTRAANTTPTVTTYSLKKTGPVVATGAAYGRGMAAGMVHVLAAPAPIEAGEIIVAPQLTAAWEATVRQAAGVIVEDANISGYAAALLRELAIPAVVGVPRALAIFKKIPTATLTCEMSGTGTVYQGILPFEVHEEPVPTAPHTTTKLYTTVTQTDRVAETAASPAAGVGLLPLEFLWSQAIGVHPLALLAAPRTLARPAITQIKEKIAPATDVKEWATQQLAAGMARVAATFYPRPVWVRLSDFASDEFINLIGAVDFSTETKNSAHQNRRGAGCYLDSTYQPAFALECAALTRVRQQFGLSNVHLVVPFCRTPEEGSQVLKLLEQHGLARGTDNLRIQVAGDIPANVVLAGEFMSLFDGIHLDITAIAKNLFATDEVARLTTVDLVNHRALKPWLHEVIKAARAAKKPAHVIAHNLVESPDLVNFLLRERVTSLTFPADALHTQATEISYIEKTVGRTGRRTSARALSLVVGLGALAVGFLSVGAGCSRAYEPLPTIAATQEVSAAQLRERWEARLNDALAHRDAATAAELATLKISGFADVTLKYPRAWSADYWAGGITLTAAGSSEYVSIFRQVLPHTAQPADAARISISGRPAVRYTLPTLTIFEISLPDGDTLEINGTNTSTTAALVETLIIGNRPATAGPGYTKWDLRERRWCAAVATFAQESKDSACVVYANSCAVPPGWTVCD